MNDLISRDAAKKIVSLMVCAPSVKIQAGHSIDNLPAVDAVPVVYARWKDYKDEHQCSACKEIVCVDPHAWKDIQFNYCPYCGAKMDGDA